MLPIVSVGLGASTKTLCAQRSRLEYKITVESVIWISDFFFQRCSVICSCIMCYNALGTLLTVGLAGVVKNINILWNISAFFSCTVYAFFVFFLFCSIAVLSASSYVGRRGAHAVRAADAPVDQTTLPRFFKHIFLVFPRRCFTVLT